MQRRGFLGMLGAIVAAPIAPTAIAPAPPTVVITVDAEFARRLRELRDYTETRLLALERAGEAQRVTDTVSKEIVRRIKTEYRRA